MKDFENIAKKYRDQLIKVKVSNSLLPLAQRRMMYGLQMSDMANTDLEKYAKALERYAKQVQIIVSV